MHRTSRSRGFSRVLLGALVPFALAASPALAHASTTPSSTRTEQAITRFYGQADRFTVREGFDRIESQRLELRPFYERFIAESHDGTLGFPINVVEAQIYDGVVSYAQVPLLSEEAAAAKAIEGSTTGAAHERAELLATYFTDGVDASTSLHARYGYDQWERDRFFDGDPVGIERLYDFDTAHRTFLADDVDGGDPFRSVEPALTDEQRTVIDLEAQGLTRTTDGLDILTSQIARGWEGRQ